MNNAGVMNATRMILSEDDVESNFCVYTLGMAGNLVSRQGFNLFFYTLGTYLLTMRLFPALEKRSQPQVVSHYVSLYASSTFAGMNLH